MTSNQDEVIRPHLIGDAFRRHKVLVLSLTLVFALGGWLLLNTQSPTYTSSVRVLVRPLVGNPLAADTGVSSQQVTIAMETEAQVVDSEAVAQQAAEHTGEPWVAGSGVVTAVVPTNTQVVAIHFRASDAAAAQAGAEETANAYLETRSAVAEDTQKRRLKILIKQLKAVQASLDKVSESATKFNAPPEAVQQVQLYANQLVTIQNSITTLQTSGGEPGTLVASPTRPTSPDGPPVALFPVLGALLGLLLGSTVALWFERRDTTIRGGIDDELHGVPVLATLTQQTGFLPSWRGKVPDERSHNDFIERLRTTTLVAAPRPAAVALAAVGPDLDIVPVTAALSSALVSAGYSVSLVIADPAGGDRDGAFSYADKGLADALSGQIPVRDLLVEVDGVHVLPAGANLMTQSARLSSPRFSAVLDKLRATHDFVIVSAPSAATADGVAVAVTADSLVLVGTDKTTSREDIEMVLRSLRQVEAPVLGIAIVPRGSPMGYLVPRTVASGTPARRLPSSDLSVEEAERPHQPA